MIQDINASLHQLLLAEDIIDVDVLRYCMSDQASINIETVLEEKIHPLAYSASMIKTDYKKIRRKFFDDKLPVRHTPEPFIKGWIFDCILTNAVIMRCVQVRSNDLRDAASIVSSASPFLLYLNTSAAPSTRYAGLADFAEIADSFIGFNCDNFQTTNTDILGKLISTVSKIDEEDWLFHEPLWRQTCKAHPSILPIIRSFFHTVFVSYVTPDHHLEHLTGLERSMIFSLMEEFCDLRVDCTTKQDILDFTYHIKPCVDRSEVNMFFHLMYEAPFSAFESIHRQNFGHQFGQTSVHSRIDCH